MAITIIGIVLILAAIGMMVGRKKQEDKLFQIKTTETLTTAALDQEAKDVRDSLGESGSYNKIVEVKGKAVCDNPLTSELARIKCVDYSMRITRKWEEKYWDTDSEGRRVRKTRQGSDTVASNDRSIPFEIEDATGRIKINPEGGNLIREKVYSKFVPGESRGSSITIGSINLDFGSLTLGSGRRTIGYSYEESAIPLGRDLYILGEAADSSGELCMQKPAEKNKKFIISVKSEEELQRSITSSVKALLIGAIASGITGIAGIILNILGVFNNM